MEDRICVRLRVPQYLADWYYNECKGLGGSGVGGSAVGSLDMVRMPRGSIENKILHYYLHKQPFSVPAREPQGANLAIMIPIYRKKHPLYYNYLPEAGRTAFLQAIRERFELQMWKYLLQAEKRQERQDNAIYGFMQAHGIEFTERNWNALAKIYQRQRGVYKGDIEQRPLRRKSNEQRLLR